MRIDSHVHYTGQGAALSPEQFAIREPYWSLLMGSDPASQAGQSDPNPQQMIEDMDRAGLDKVVLFGNYWWTHEACVETNSRLLSIMMSWPDRVLGFASVQPKAGPKALDELKRCVDCGMVGVGELGAYGQGYSLEDPDFLRVVEACIVHGIPLNLHANEPVGHFYPGKGTTALPSYYRLACRYPELKLILAHWGGGLLFYELMPEVKRVLGNVYYDTAASPLLFPTEDIFRVALQCVDRRKILYGSDYPLPICRKKQRGPDFRPFLAEISDLALPPETHADIMGRNLARLLGLVPEDTPRQTSGLSPLGSSSTARWMTEAPDGEVDQISPDMSVQLVAQAWPGTRPVFERYGIAWQDNPVPFWEPIVQAAAVRGWNTIQRQKLMAEINEAARCPEQAPDEGAI